MKIQRMMNKAVRRRMMSPERYIMMIVLKRTAGREKKMRRGGGGRGNSQKFSGNGNAVPQAPYIKNSVFGEILWRH